MTTESARALSSPTNPGRFAALHRSTDLHRVQLASRGLHLIVALAALLLCWTQPATAAKPAPYVVEIGAPRDLEKLLQDNLDIVRWSKREDVTPGQIEQLYKTAPEQIGELLATEGFFSPQVIPSIGRLTSRI